MFTFFTVPTALYIDPAATSALLASAAGIVVAIGATAVILWRKAKKKVTTVLHIDENANKEVEEDIVINEPAEEVAAQAEAVSSDKE